MAQNKQYSLKCSNEAFIVSFSDMFNDQETSNVHIVTYEADQDEELLMNRRDDLRGLSDILARANRLALEHGAGLAQLPETEEPSSSSARVTSPSEENDSDMIEREERPEHSLKRSRDESPSLASSPRQDEEYRVDESSAETPAVEKDDVTREEEHGGEASSPLSSATQPFGKPVVFYAHRDILRARTGFFKTRFNSRWDQRYIRSLNESMANIEKMDLHRGSFEAGPLLSGTANSSRNHARLANDACVVYVPEFAPDIIRTILEYVYGLPVEVSGDRLLRLMMAAEFFDVPELKNLALNKYCSDFVTENGVLRSLGEVLNPNLIHVIPDETITQLVSKLYEDYDLLWAQGAWYTFDSRAMTKILSYFNRPVWIELHLLFLVLRWSIAQLPDTDMQSKLLPLLFPQDGRPVLECVVEASEDLKQLAPFASSLTPLIRLEMISSDYNPYITILCNVGIIDTKVLMEKRYALTEDYGPTLRNFRRFEWRDNNMFPVNKRCTSVYVRSREYINADSYIEIICYPKELTFHVRLHGFAYMVRRWKKIYSPWVMMCDKYFRLLVYPGGDIGAEDFISVFVACDESPTMEKGPHDPKGYGNAPDHDNTMASESGDWNYAVKFNIVLNHPYDVRRTLVRMTDSNVFCKKTP
eukprot:CAMPEP_0184707202 /NCGR_PEP_ID=MMETSP0313-20130426/37150_1 /TAXON_ID=2792 /ORGANISM="Porphyridium aerugineum, Strain SAG 1380-2" /LENGTH=643 /DNA_ID=CAMNT_0027168775 /DNA_START=27 /DNA_END=1954 /DNA_ORIENTATION=-